MKQTGNIKQIQDRTLPIGEKSPKATGKLLIISKVVPFNKDWSINPFLVICVLVDTQIRFAYYVTALIIYLSFRFPTRKLNPY